MYTQHAIDCGINMTGKLALAVEDSAGWLLMLDIIDPVTRAPVIHAGTTMDIQLIAVAQSYGVDYVVVYHRIFPPRTACNATLDRTPTLQPTKPRIFKPAQRTCVGLRKETS